MSEIPLAELLERVAFQYGPKMPITQLLSRLVAAEPKSTSKPADLEKIVKLMQTAIDKIDNALERIDELEKIARSSAIPNDEPWNA